MAETTTNYGLKKPLAEEFYSVNDQNGNMEIIDRVLKDHADSMKALEEALSGAGNVFLATYDVTTSAEIETALTAKKAVFCVYKAQGVIAPMVSASEGVYIFVLSGQYNMTVITCWNNTWVFSDSGYKPSNHAYTHCTNGDDPLAPSSIGAYSTTEVDNKLKNKADLDSSGKVPSSQLPEMSASGKRASRLTVATSQNGWTSADCDYLCDGTADEAEINAAIQALGSEGGEVVILDGNYTLSSAIIIEKGNVTLKGNGANTKLIRHFNDASGSIGMVRVTGDYFTMCDLFINGAKGSYSEFYNVGIDITGNRSTITNCVFIDCKRRGIQIDGDNNIVTNNILTGNGVGIYVSFSNKNVIANNVACNNTEHGLELYGLKQSVIVGNVCNSNTENGIDTLSLTNCTINGNTCLGNALGLYGYSITNNIISGNIFNGNNSYGMNLKSNCSNNIIGANAYKDNTSGEFLDESSGGNLMHLPTKYGTSDLTAGTSALATGVMHLVYE